MHRKILTIIGLLLSCVTCNSSNNKSQLSALTGSGAKYWDKIYATDIYDRHQNPIDKLGKSRGCVKFEKSGRVTHYDYLDSLTIISSGCNSDIVFNPDSFAFGVDSTLRFGGRKYIVNVLSKDIMILKFGSNEKTATIIYRASKLQDKRIVPCK